MKVSITEHRQNLIDRLLSCVPVERKERTRNQSERRCDMFNMSRVHYVCGSPSCVAGHNEDLIKSYGQKICVHRYENILRMSLGISEHQSKQIFNGWYSAAPREQITIEETVNYLKKVFESNPASDKPRLLADLNPVEELL